MGDKTKIAWTDALSEETAVGQCDSVDHRFSPNKSTRRHPRIDVLISLGGVARFACRYDVARGRSPSIGHWHHVVERIGNRTAICTHPAEFFQEYFESFDRNRVDVSSGPRMCDSSSPVGKVGSVSDTSIFPCVCLAEPGSNTLRWEPSFAPSTPRKPFHTSRGTLRLRRSRSLPWACTRLALGRKPVVPRSICVKFGVWLPRPAFPAPLLFALLPGKDLVQRDPSALSKDLHRSDVGLRHGSIVAQLERSAS